MPHGMLTVKHHGHLTVHCSGLLPSPTQNGTPSAVKGCHLRESSWEAWMSSGTILIIFPKDLLVAGYLARWTVVWLNTAILTFVKLPACRNPARKPCSDTEWKNWLQLCSSNFLLSRTTLVVLFWTNLAAGWGLLFLPTSFLLISRKSLWRAQHQHKLSIIHNYSWSQPTLHLKSERSTKGISYFYTFLICMKKCHVLPAMILTHMLFN